MAVNHIMLSRDKAMTRMTKHFAVSLCSVCRPTNVGGGLQMQTDLPLGPAGDVWVMNNWTLIDSCFGAPLETLSTLCGGQGVAIFFGIAKPVRTPSYRPGAQAINRLRL